MSFAKVASLALTVGLLTISNAVAGSCGYDRCWGAVAIGPNGQAWAHSYSSERAAINAIANNCRGRCSTIKTFYNTCGAIASSPSGA